VHESASSSFVGRLRKLRRGAVFILRERAGLPMLREEAEDLPRALGEGSPFFLGGTEAAGSEAEGQAEAKRPAASVCDMGQAVTWFETPRLDSSRLAEGGSNGVTRRARALRDTSRWNG
jgi:hypothetical protein